MAEFDASIKYMYLVHVLSAALFVDLTGHALGFSSNLTIGEQARK